MSYTYDRESFRENFEREFIWLNGFMRNVRRYGTKIALIDPSIDKSWTYSELNGDCNKLANALKADGIRQSDILLMQLYNSPQFVFGYIASHKTGAVANPINFNLSAGETAEIIEHNKPKVYIYDADIINTAASALEISRHKPDVILVVNNSGKEIDMPEGHILYDEYVSKSSTNDIPVDFEPNVYNESLRLQTSGTTATPKEVPLNNMNEILSAHNLIMDLGLKSSDVTMNLTPWFHRGGIHSTGPTTIFYLGGTTVIMRSFNPKNAVRYINEYKITYLTAVPAVLHPMCARLEKYNEELPSLKGILSMGAPLEREACIRFMTRLTPNIYNGYGTTETLWNLFLGPDDLPERSGFTGRASTDDEVRLVKIHDDRRAEPDELVSMDEIEKGEIIIKCPAKTGYSYADNSDITEKKYYKGWFYTGDVGVWNKDGYVRIIGRKDDMIISMGENVYPARIEEIINEHPKVSECIVTGIHHKTKGEVIAAYVIPADDSLTVSELVEHCTSSPHLSKYQIPRYYRFVSDIPRTATGKKQHYLIRKQAQQDLENGLFERKSLSMAYAT
ncbi:MAG: acyl--CoA ligase [Ruminococcus sp.]|nr:acyl--CoA ligase [Ruminococcus sp.]